MKSQQLIAGVDVSKDTLDVYFNDAGGKEHYLKVSNDKKGHDLLIGKIGVQRTYLMESSGPYYLRLAFAIKKLKGDVRIENPIARKALYSNAFGTEQVRQKGCKMALRLCEAKRYKRMEAAAQRTALFYADHGFY